MRFTQKKELLEAYFNDDKKTKTKFLWWPMTISGETRWLETAEIVYVVRKELNFFLDDYYYYWSPREFINK